jgi:hypothetical protein
MRLLSERVAGDAAAPVNPLADVLITEVLDAANSALTAEDAEARKMTTGAAYNIWPAQSDFQMDLMARVLDEAATPGIERVRSAALSALARQLPWQEVLAAAIEVDFSESFEEPAMFLMIGVAALASPADVLAGERRANERYVAATTELLSAIVEYSGRRLRPGRSIEDLVWAVEALEAGLLLRMRRAPEIPLREDAQGVSVLATAAIGLVEAFTEPQKPASKAGRHRG